MAARLTLEEREISLNQSAQDRHDGIWHVYTNDSYYQRRLKRIGAVDLGNGFYEIGHRQVLLRLIPKARQAPRIIEFQKRKQERLERAKAGATSDLVESR